MMDCPNSVIVDIEFTCKLRLRTNGQSIQVNIEFGDGYSLVVSGINTVINIRKTYRYIGIYTYETKILNNSLVNENSNIKGKFILKASFN